MKSFFTFAVIFSMITSAAFAGEHVLTGADAKSVVQILETAGIKSGANSFEAFDVMCEGQNFQDRCFASLQGVDPASSRLDIAGSAASELWSLIKKAGFKSFVSEISDGSAGWTIIEGGNVRCSGDQCSFDGT